MEAMISTKWQKDHSSVVSIVLFGTWLRVSRNTPIAIHQKIPFQDYQKQNFCVQCKQANKKENPPFNSICVSIKLWKMVKQIYHYCKHIFPLYVAFLFHVPLERVFWRKCALDTKTNRRATNHTGMCAVRWQSQSCVGLSAGLDGDQCFYIVNKFSSHWIWLTPLL